MRMRRSAYENGIVEVRLWVDAWQTHCCGEPFALGDAAAMIHGLERGLKLLEEISGQMAGHRRLTTVRAPLYEGWVMGRRRSPPTVPPHAGRRVCVSSST